MSRIAPSGYSLAQIVLHWAVVVLIIFQYLAHDAMEAAWDALRDGAAIPDDILLGANLHAAAGMTVLILALIRLFLRFTRGAPALPSNLSPPLAFVAKATHFLLYALIIGLPIGGAAAWLGGVAVAARVHGLGANVLFWVAIIHVLGALYEHFVVKSDVLRRMLKPEAR